MLLAVVLIGLKYGNVKNVDMVFYKGIEPIDVNYKEHVIEMPKKYITDDNYCFSLNWQDLDLQCSDLLLRDLHFKINYLNFTAINLNNP